MNCSGNTAVFVQFLTFRGSSFTFSWVDVKSTLVGLEAKLEKVVLLSEY